MNRIKYVILSVIGVALMGVIFVLHQLGGIEVRQTKDYAEMYVDETDILDGKAIVSPPEKYSQLLQIDVRMRKRVGEYMEKNRYKLKSGKQEFIRNNPSFAELIEDGFQFETFEE